MRARRTARTVRLNSTAPHSLVRIRTSSKAKSRKRPAPKFLAEKLKATRKRLGMSQSEIAKAVGVDNRASISGYERGEREPPLPTLLAYARLGNVPLEYFVDDMIGVRVVGPTKGN